MSRWVYVNGRYAPWRTASVHVEDRGFQFADAVYEVCEVLAGRPVDEARHLARLERSLAALEIPLPMSLKALSHVLCETVRRNRVIDGLVYIQVTRGVHRRNFFFPPEGTRPTVVCLAEAVSRRDREALAHTGISVVTVPDIRWRRCDIKTVMLLPAVLAKMTAQRRGAREAWLLDENGYVTEGASSTAWIVDHQGLILTHPCGPQILPGVTRASLLDLLVREGLRYEERPFHREEALQAAEAFVTSASQTVMPVTAIDGVAVGAGKPGALSQHLRARFHEYAASQAGARP